MTTYSEWKTFADALRLTGIARFGTSSGFAAGVVADANFVICKQPWQDVIPSYPAVLLFPLDPRLEIPTNAETDWTHSVAVSIVHASNRSQSTYLDVLNAWFEAFVLDLHGQRLKNAPSFYCEVEPRAIIDPRAFSLGVDAAQFVVRAKKRYNRPTQAT